MTTRGIAGSIVMAMAISTMVGGIAGAADFEFRPSQVVFIHAQTINGSDDAAFENRLQKLFMDRKVFYVTHKITEADFVFWAFTDYRVQTIQLDCDKWYKPCTQEKGYLAFAEGFALSPDDYLGGFSNRYDLRAAAHWQWMVGSTTRISRPERHSRKLVKEFHEQIIHQMASR